MKMLVKFGNLVLFQIYKFNCYAVYANTNKTLTSFKKQQVFLIVIHIT